MRPANGLLKMELTMKDYAKGFHDMIESLRADHEISVVSSYIFPGASDADIVDAVEILGCKLDETLEAFYRQCNGLQLRWIRRDSEDFNDGEFGTYTNAPVSMQDIIEDSHRLDGCINLFPLNIVISKSTGIKVAPNSLYVDTYTILGESFSPHEFCINSYVMDGFDADRGMVLFPIRSKNLQLCIMSAISYSQFQNSKKVRPINYLDLLLTNKGEIWSRVQALKLNKGMLIETIDELDF